MRLSTIASAAATLVVVTANAQFVNPNRIAYQQCYNNWVACKQEPDPNQSYCASQVETCFGTADNKCRTAPDANQSYCSSLFSEYYDKTGITPPTPGKRAERINARGTNPDQEAYEQCYNEWIACKQAPHANQSFCGSQVGSCFGKADGACRTAPEANQSYCSSLYSEYYSKTGITPPQPRVASRAFRA